MNNTNMENTINKRIATLIAAKGMNVTSFSKLIGIAQTSLRDVINGGAEPKFSTLEKIIIAEPMINPSWLLTGKGNMLKDDGLMQSQIEVRGANRGNVVGSITGDITGNIVGNGRTDNHNNIPDNANSLLELNAERIKLLEKRVEELESDKAILIKEKEGLMQLLMKLK